MKKIAVMLSMLILLLTLCPGAAVSADEVQLYTGDTVQYIFSIGDCGNVAGIVVESSYNADCLTLAGTPEFVGGLGGMINPNELGAVRFNTMINGGRSFSGDDIFIETFTVNKKCLLSEAALSFECTEAFSDDLSLLPLDIVSARVETQNTGTDDDITSDTDPSTDTELFTDTDSSTETEILTDTEAFTDIDTEDPASSRTESKKNEPKYDSDYVSSLRHVIITTTDNVDSDDEDDTTASVTSSRKTTSRIPSVTSRAASSKSASSASSKAVSSVNSTRSAASAASSTAASSSSAVSSSASKAASELTSSETGSSSKSTVSVKSASLVSASNESTVTSPATSSKTAIPTAGKLAAVLIIAVLAAAGVTMALTRKGRSRS